MSRFLLLIYLWITLPLINSFGQPGKDILLHSPQKNTNALPGQVINLPFFIENITDSACLLRVTLDVPEKWKLISQVQNLALKPLEKKFLIYSIQIPSNYAAGIFGATLKAIDHASGIVRDSFLVYADIGEVEKIEMHRINSPEYMWAGQESDSEFKVQNLGNGSKKIFIEAVNCELYGTSEVVLEPGESYTFNVRHAPSEELTETTKEYFTVRALTSGEVVKSIFSPLLVFPVKEKKVDLYSRFPVKASLTYLTSNQSDQYEHAYQLEFSGNGFVDPDRKHQLEFLARGPNNTNLSFLGLYDQYYVSYRHKNLEMFAGEKAYEFTPLTESSRFGLGGQGKVLFNNGLNFGFLYVKPRFYENIQHEMAAVTGFEFNPYNKVEVFFISKQPEHSPGLAQLVSISSKFQPLKKTTVEVEISGGEFMNQWDKAYRGNLNAQFYVFSLAGSYYYAGKDYPGYYSNSTFYSGNATVRLSEKINLGLYAREDFRNAQLDTFFVTAPYSKSYQSLINYNIAHRTNLRFFWRQYERKDRLAFDKFHYQTSSVNTHFNQQFRKLNYILTAELGTTTNFLLESGKNQQTMYSGSINLDYRFNENHAVRLMGSYSNVNSFISGEQNNFIAGISLNNQLAKNLLTTIHLQNAYSIEEYYRNRNLVRFSLDYSPNKTHKISLRSFYTLFRQQTENPELTLSLNYAFSFGIPLKKIITAGDLSGYIYRENGEPAEGVILTFMNRTTITDKNGRYSFKTIPSGRHFLFIDNSNLAINEILQVPNPVEIEILEDKAAELNFNILDGTRLSGEFVIGENNLKVPGEEPSGLGNIVVELSGTYEQFRIESNKKGSFSFPLLRPGDWTFKVYVNSIPDGFEIDQSTIPLHLNPGQAETLQITLKPKKRNIIFKPIPDILRPLNQLNKEQNRNQPNQQPAPASKPADDIFYSIQIGAFRKKLSKESEFFKGFSYDLELEINNLHKYFTGKYSSQDEAVKEQEKLSKIYNNAFVVKFVNGQLIQTETKQDP